jgi:CRP-like cAMP-binding protein
MPYSRHRLAADYLVWFCLRVLTICDSVYLDYLGMSREVFSRNLKRLSHQGISVTKKTITITDKEKLCKYCYFLISD